MAEGLMFRSEQTNNIEGLHGFWKLFRYDDPAPRTCLSGLRDITMSMSVEYRAEYLVLGEALQADPR